ncbi:hypothetical protein [uncultured Fibrobacter sp.]|uniref:hypothetical protein n=1 Tax=uncultured Fibrobacter sp. TaxID=261512 RepID=UPI002631EF56|nr:hypothetical protein [uncultured Fibrobacter sp.]
MNRICLLGLSLAIVFSACGESKVNVSYKNAAPVKVELYEEGYFSTIDLKGEEKMGTVTAAYVNLEYSSVGDTLKLHRDYVMDKSRGYLKNYMPSELAWRAKSVDLVALDRNVLSIEGLSEGYDSLLAHLPMPEVWRKQLLNPDYKPHLKRLEKHRWEMDHLLLGEVPTKGNITQMLRDQGRLNFALIRVDSVVVKGFEHRDHRRCLDYVVYLQETESFPYYIWEQHVNSNIVPEKFKKYNKGLKAEYATQFEVMIDPETGVPCQEREVKVGTHTMVNPETKDTTTFKSQVTLERLFTVKKPGEETAE